jgi:predicted negative regulator of RcsB-dependent stress response
MLSSKTSRWLGFFILLMLGLRLGYKYYRSQQPSAAEEHMANAQDRSKALIEAIKADQERQRASGATVVLADSTLVAADTASAN